LFDDDDGAISGTAQELSELTGTLEYKPRDNFLMRLEARQDWSTAFVFGGELLADGTQELKKRQFLLLVNAVASF
ncbi:MAG TPA: outer membrane beta-barrel protein, partial [Vicinamibacteria bacterium]